MGISKASAQWVGGLKDGKGTMTPAHAAEIPFSVGSRFEGQPASNPEELIGAALAGCFSMALTAALERGGYKPKSIKTLADVKLERQGEAFTITQIDLSCDANVPGIEAQRFEETAQATKKACPVSKALAATTITLKATLQS